jgi:hypothetical protein
MAALFRYLGIVGDGATDRAVLAKLIRVLVPGPFEEIRLRQSLAVPMATYRNEAARTGRYGLTEAPAGDLRKSIINVLFAAISDLKSEASRDLKEYDLLIVSTDAEWFLGHSDEYFKDQRFLILTKIFFAAIEEFYHKASNRHVWEHLPVIIPLVLFPSTDILVAAAKAAAGSPFVYHGMKAREIKKSVYGVDGLHQLRGDDLEKKALAFISPAGSRAIYQHLPEIKIFLRTLTYHQLPHAASVGEQSAK